MRKIFAIFAVLGFASLGFLLWLENYYTTGNALRQSSTVIIEKGDGLRIIAHKLGQAQIIESPEIFLISARLSRQNNLQQGEYEFDGGTSPQQVLQKLANGERKTRKFTIPEGKTAYEAEEILKSSEGFKGELPQIAEGSILPSTYHYYYGDNYQDAVKQMQDEMQKTIAELWPKRAADLPIATPEQAIILASIVERETGDSAERGLVASVFINRLKKGMRLESDPTAVYGITLGKPLGHIPSAAIIDTASAYNTYLIDGLPPTPIANPGRAAIEAVLNPPQTDYLFFVANGEGGHNFSATLKEHNNNVKKYRKVMAALRG